MARTLSDAVIIAMIEAATRLAGGRGPIAGSTAAAAMAQTGEKPPVETAAATAAGAAPAGGAAPSPAPAMGATGPSADAAPDGDARTADQIATDFKAIYTQVETLVRVSAEQETPRVGFGPRSS